jgi:hypothetical protein
LFGGFVGAVIGYFCYLAAVNAGTGDGLTDNMFVATGFGCLLGSCWGM